MPEVFSIYGEYEGVRVVSFTRSRLQIRQKYFLYLENIRVKLCANITQGAEECHLRYFYEVK
jgi:hypothetical protein